MYLPMPHANGRTELHVRVGAGRALTVRRVGRSDWDGGHAKRDAYPKRGSVGQMI